MSHNESDQGDNEITFKNQDKDDDHERDSVSGSSRSISSSKLAAAKKQRAIINMAKLKSKLEFERMKYETTKQLNESEAAYLLSDAQQDIELAQVDIDMYDDGLNGLKLNTGLYNDESKTIPITSSPSSSSESKIIPISSSPSSSSTVNNYNSTKPWSMNASAPTFSVSSASHSYILSTGQSPANYGHQHTPGYQDVSYVQPQPPGTSNHMNFTNDTNFQTQNLSNYTNFQTQNFANDLQSQNFSSDLQGQNFTTDFQSQDNQLPYQSYENYGNNAMNTYAYPNPLVSYPLDTVNYRSTYNVESRPYMSQPTYTYQSIHVTTSAPDNICLPFVNSTTTPFPRTSDQIHVNSSNTIPPVVNRTSFAQTAPAQSTNIPANNALNNATVSQCEQIPPNYVPSNTSQLVYNGMVPQSMPVPASRNPINQGPEHKPIHDANARQNDISVLLQNQNQFFQSMTTSLKTGLHMPKPELMYFNGEPTSYHSFMSNFDVNVDKVIDDNMTKLNYLIQYCSGEAKKAIADCVLLNPTEGYNRARDILLKRFGQPHSIAQSYVNQLTSGQPIRNGDTKALLDLNMLMDRCNLTLGRIGYSSDINNAETLLKIIRRFPYGLRVKWAERADTIIQYGSEPNFNDLCAFIDRAARVSNTLYGKDLKVNQQPPVLRSSYRRPTGNTFVMQSTRPNDDAITRGEENTRSFSNIPPTQRPCSLCSQLHGLWMCPDFKKKSVPERMRYIQELKLCHNCFRKGHVAHECWRPSFCRKCQYKHNDLIHVSNEGNANAQSVNGQPDHFPPDTHDAQQNSQTPGNTGTNCNVTSNTYAGTGKISMRVVPVNVQAVLNGPIIQTYALLDECSDVSLINKRIADELKAEGDKATFSLTTINANNQSESRRIKLQVRSIGNEHNIELNQVWTVNKIPISEKSIPNKDDVNRWPHMKDVTIHELAQKEVGLLIGCDTPQAFWQLEERRGTIGEPLAIKSLLGWTIIGPTRTGKIGHRGHVNYIHYEDTLLHQQIERFWLTDFGDNGKEEEEMSIDDKTALEKMKISTTMVDGHYQISLPWREEPPNLPNNRDMATTRINLLKKRLQKDENLRKAYQEVMNDYISKGYAREIKDEGRPENNVWYIPHHPVKNPYKPDKIRIVFDCAASYRNTSLNDQLLQGPDLNNKLLGVLLRFRQERVAFVGDIQAMFHQVRVHPKDRDALRFLWWPDSDLNQEPRDHQMCVHLFGATSSPSVCAYAVQKTAEDNKHTVSPETLDTVRRNFYVDDMLKSVKSDDEAVQLIKELRLLMASGGFHLTKWVSNSDLVMATIPDEDKGKSATSLDLDFETTPAIEHVLGVQWNVQQDTFQIRSVPREKPYTRRGILSIVSSVYDPLGFMAPITLTGKLILQELCKDGAGWDSPVSQSIRDRWNSWLQELPSLSNVNIPRSVKPNTSDEIAHTELHHFADASSVGYGCASYLRMTDTSGKVGCSFVTGKSRLAPIKTITIPRLELSAAVLAVKNDKIIKRELDLQIDSTFYWTDSTAVLQYIENTSSRYKTFVANRLTLIHEHTIPTQWRYVPTELNPADYASRGLAATDGDKLDNWLKGPEFLQEEEGKWPVRPQNLPNLMDPNEVKTEATVNLVSQDTGLDSMIISCSSWYTLRKRIAVLRKFKEYMYKRYVLKETEIKIQKEITVDDLKKSETDIIRYAQKQSYDEEVRSLGRPGKVPKKSPLKNLNPTLHGDLLRVGGRISNANLDYSVKHPIILPKNHPITTTIIQDYHRSLGHMGTNYVLSHIRRKFWVINGTSTVKQVISQCHQCRRNNAKPCEQVMSQLPTERLTPDKPPFTYVGVDYFGPVYVRLGRRTDVKRYGCIFSCMTTRAIHIEISHSLTTSSFLSAFTRFCARRGTPDKVYSDNGTNLRGGETELRESIREFNQSQITDSLRQKEIMWSFNPPRASHFGGHYERMIRTTRKVLRSIATQQTLNDEGLLTVMAEAEKIVNDRPITKATSDSRDADPLTPSQLLLLRPNSCLPPGTFDKKHIYTQRWWRQAHYLSNLFWRRWVREYLPLLQTMTKWQDVKENLVKDDVVLIMHENLPRGKWPLGVVIETYPDRRGHVRSVKLRTGRTEKVRPIAKLCLLESHNESLTQVETNNANRDSAGRPTRFDENDS